MPWAVALSSNHEVTIMRTRKMSRKMESSWDRSSGLAPLYNRWGNQGPRHCDWPRVIPLIRGGVCSLMLGVPAAWSNPFIQARTSGPQSQLDGPGKRGLQPRGCVWGRGVCCAHMHTCISGYSGTIQLQSWELDCGNKQWISPSDYCNSLIIIWRTF